MVQRAKLALILLLLALALSLTAQVQEGFTPPKLLTETALTIPVDWKQTYDPMQVLILVNVKIDSTGTLVKILDGKDELQSRLETLLPDLVFFPAQNAGKPVESQMSIQLPIVYNTPQKQPSVINDSLFAIEKKGLYDWINHARNIENRQHLFSADSLDSRGYLPQIYDTYYTTNYYMLGLNGNPYLVRKDGFLQNPHLYNNALQYQMLSNFRQVNSQGGILDFANPHYPLPALCTDVYAGLGDYEFNFARIQILKNHLLGVKDFYTEIGLLVQNGFWEETISNQTSSRVFLSIPVKGTTVSFDYEKYDQNIPSTSLLPGYQETVLYSIAQILQDVYFKWQLPWFTLGWRSEAERLTASQHLNPQKYSVNQLMLSSDFASKFADLNLQYQYNYKRKFPVIQQLYQYDRHPEHQLVVTASKHISSLDYTILAAASPQTIDTGQADLGYSNFLGRLGLVYGFYKGGNHTVIADTIFPGSNQSILAPAAYEHQRIGLRYNLPLLRGVIWDASFGIRTINTATSQYVLFSDPPKDYLTIAQTLSEDKPWFASTYLQIRKKFWDNEAQFDQTLQWTQFKPGLYELPEWQGQTRLKISRDMGYHNVLSAGLNLTGHTDYLEAGQIPATRFGALVADAWLGVKITDLFEFQVTWKNLGNNIMYGVLPEPRALMASIHWFYLN